MPAALLLLAEVADKEGPLWIPWLSSGFLATLAFVLVRWRLRAIWVMAPLSLAWAWLLVDSATEPHWLPSLLAELGPGYVALQLAPAPIALLAAVAPVVRAELPAARAWWAARSQRTAAGSRAVEPSRGASPDAAACVFPRRLLVVGVAVAAALGPLATMALTRIAAARAGR